MSAPHCDPAQLSVLCKRLNTIGSGRILQSAEAEYVLGEGGNPVNRFYCHAHMSSDWC